MVVLAEAVFLRKRLTPMRLLAVLLAFVGCALVLDPFAREAIVSPLGVALGLGAAVGYTVFNMLSHRWLPGRSRIVLMAYTFGIASIGIALVAFFSGATLSVAEWTPRVWALLGLIVLFPTFIAVVLYLSGIERLGPSQASILSTVEPIFTIVLASIVLGERFSAIQWMGALLVMAAVTFAEREARPADDLAVV
jgi:drug/metabolite transporter (DMT)-like permease